jgi:hypothetical protein
MVKITVIGPIISVSRGKTIFDPMEWSAMKSMSNSYR